MLPLRISSGELRRRVVVLAGALVAAVIGAVFIGAAPQAQEPGPRAVVYRGPASCPGCSEAVANLIRQSPREFSVAFIGPKERLKLTPENLRGVELYAQPGGNGSVARAQRVFGYEANKTVKGYVAGGGHYVGFCMGAYLAGTNPGMGLLSPGNTGQYIRTRGASVKTTRNAVIPVGWQGASRRHFAQDPPYIIPSGVAGERILSRFTNNKVNALVRPYGEGGVGVVGTHPEATRSWYSSELWKRDKDKLDAAQGLRLIAYTMQF